MNRWVKISLAGFAIILALGVCLGTNLISGWGLWYSRSMPYRQQTEAMLQGHIAISTSPTALQGDFAWGRGSVQQVWGLGVPFWRLPFEALAKLFGQPGFPDRLALAAAWALMIYFVLIAFLIPARPRTGWLTQLDHHPERIATIIMLILFPPVVTLCHGRFNVYEEPICYGYLYSIGLFAGLIAFLRRPRIAAYLALCLLGGLAGFIRPTFECYGIASSSLAFLLAWRARWRWWQVLAGPMLFAIGGGLLFLSNWQRFGSGFEFGHNLNITSQELIFTARFGTPFDQEPFWSAARELFGSLFQVLDITYNGYYGRTVVAFQSPTQRWREYYEGTFNYSILALLLVCWGRAAWRFVATKIVKRPADIWDSELYVVALWSFISLGGLCVFYLRFHAISARYVLDLSAGFAVACAGGLMVKQRANLLSTIWCYLVLTLFAVWWCWDVSAAKVNAGDGGAPAEILSQWMPHGFPELRTLPKRYGTGDRPEPMPGIIGNGLGWNNKSGQAYYAVSLFFDSPQKISLLVAPRYASEITEETYAHIRAKVGLEYLKLESMADTAQGKRLTFAGPRRGLYRHGIQLVSLGFIKPEEFNRRLSPFRLLEVSCDDNP